MPELKGREKYESEVQTALLLVFDEYSQQALASSGFALPGFQGAIVAAVSQPLVETYRAAAEQLAAGKSEDFAGSASEWAAGRARVLAGNIEASTRAALQKGADPDSVFGAARAGVIAATEITTAITAGEAAAVVVLSLFGPEPIAIWHTEADGRVCPLCAPLHHTEPVVWKAVSPSGPPAHPNCRCWLEYTIR